MKPVEEYRGKEYCCTVEYIEVSLLSHELAVFAHDILNNSKDGPNHDEAAGDIEDYEEFFPRCCDLEAGGGGIVIDSAVEDDCNDNKHAKEDELDKEADDDNDLTLITSRLGVGSSEHAAT